MFSTSNMLRVFFVGTLFAFLALSTAVAQDITRVDEIRRAPGQFLNEVTTVEGYATQYIENPAQSTSFYYLKDDYGGIITIRTTKEAPAVGQRYTVSGPVGIDPRREDPYISEEARVQAATEAPAEGEAGEPAQGAQTSGQEPGTQAGTAASPGTGSDSNQSLVYLLVGAIGLVLVVLVGVLVYVLRSRQQAAPQTVQGPRTSVANQPPSRSPAVAATQNGQVPEPEEVIEDKTIKMHAPPQGTLKILPGRLQVKSGLDNINEIRFYKPKGQAEPAITFGRSEGKPYQHIQLKPRTVSSKQAKLVFNKDKDQYTVVNYASESSNPTRVNGQPLGMDEAAPLKDGDRLTMGEVEFEYTTN